MSKPYKRTAASARIQHKRWDQGLSNWQGVLDNISATHVSDLKRSTTAQEKQASTDRATSENKASLKAFKAGAMHPAITASEAKTLGLPPLSSIGKSKSQRSKVGGPIKLKASLRM